MQAYKIAMSAFGLNIYEPQRCIYGIILMFT